MPARRVHLSAIRVGVNRDPPHLFIIFAIFIRKRVAEPARPDARELVYLLLIGRGIGLYNTQFLGHFCEASVVTMLALLQLPLSLVLRPASAPLSLQHSLGHMHAFKAGAAIYMMTPADVGEAKSLFQKELKGRILSMPAQSFANNMLMQQVALCAPNYQYSSVFSLGFETLCSVFLPPTCNTPENEEVVRRALYIGLGMDADQAKADSDALLSLASGKTEDELLATDEFIKIKGADFKYSYQFGAGLVRSYTQA